MIFVEPEVTHINEKISVRKIKKSFSEKEDSFFESTEFQGGSQKRTSQKLIFLSWLSALIDLMITISLSCFALILFTVLSKFQLLGSLKLLLFEKSLFQIFSITFLFLLWMYLILTRYFMAATLGEWSCQIRIGLPSQRLQNDYFLRVLVRSTVIMLTGVFLLPLLSLIFKRDFVGDLCGLKILSLE